jgi:hypothetical protein
LFKAIDFPKLNHEISNICSELEEQKAALREVGQSKQAVELLRSFKVVQPPAVPLAEPVRPNSPHQPAVELVEDETELDPSLIATLGQSIFALSYPASSLAVVIEKMRRKAEGNGPYSFNEYQMDVRALGEEVRSYHALSDFKNKVWAELLNTSDAT